MTATEIGIGIAINFFTGCTQQLLSHIDQKVATARGESKAWKERSKTFEQRIIQQLNLTARSIHYPAQHLDRLRSVLSDQVFMSEVATAFLDGRLDSKTFAAGIAARDAELKGEQVVSEIAQGLLETFTAGVAADPELARIVGLKRSEGVKRHLIEIDAKLDENRALLTEIAGRTVLGGKPGEQLTPQERYDRAFAEVASAHSLTVAQLHKAIADFVACVSSDSAATEFDQALALFAQQKYASAEVQAKKAVQDAEQALESTLDAKRKALLLLGDIERAQLKYAAAEKSYREAFTIAEQQDLLLAAEAGWRLSTLLGELGRYDEAVALSTRFLEIAEQNFSGAGTMVALNHLGLALQGAGRYAEAEPVLRRALELWELQSRREDLMLATHLHNFSTVLRSLGRRREAEPIGQRALAIRQRLLGEEHPDIATCLTNVALLLDDQGKLEEAEALLRKALASYRKFLRADHPYCVTATSNLAMNLKAQGKVDEAEPLLKSTVDATQQVFGSEHPHFADSLNNFGEVLLARRKLQDALQTFRQALSIHQKSLGAEHPNTQLVANNLGTTLVFARCYAEAEQVLRETLAIKERVMAKDDISIANTVNNLGFAIYAQRRFDEAESFYRRALTLRRRSLPPTHPEVGNTLGNLGLLLHETGRYSEAQEAFRSELEIREQQQPPSDTAIALALNNLAAAQYLDGKLDDAVGAFEKSVEYCREHFGEEHAMTKDARDKVSTARARLSAQPRTSG